MTSLDKYIKELTLNFRSNHPVTIVYTDDPNDTLALTRDAMSTVREKTDKLFYWTSRERWTDLSDKNKSLAELIATPSIIELKNKQSKTPLQFTFSSPDELKARNPVFILSLLSTQFKADNMGIMQELRDFDYLVRNGVNDTYRIIVLANKSFDIPTDYENIFGIVHHNLPETEELEQVFDEYFIEDFIKVMFAPNYDGSPEEIVKLCQDQKTYCVNTLNGLSARQFKIILYKAVSHSVERLNKTVFSGIDFDKFREFIYERKFEEISRTEVIELLKPLPIESVGGLDELKGWTQERQWAFTDEAKALRVERPKGMALIGPPGTGKTHYARAVASLLEYPCFKLNAGNIFSKWVGESEQRIKNVLSTLDSLAPCVVFIDEIDKVFASQAGGNRAGDSGTSARVFGQILSWMQDTKKEIFLVVTANRIQNIPAEFLRKGRLDEIFFVTFPTRKERKEILNIHLKQRGYEVKTFESVLDATQDFSASELEFVVKESILKAGKAKKKLSEEFMLAEVKRINPSSIAFKNDVDAMLEWAKTHARPASLPEVEITVDKSVEL